MKARLFLRLVSALALAMLAVPIPALAAPTNDYFGSATAIGALPYSDSEDISLATTEPGEPQMCNFSPRTVWYSFTPSANAQVRADMVGSSFSDTNLRVYQAISSGIFGLSLVPNGCATFGGSVTFSAQAGATYYLQAGTVFSSFGTARVNVQAILPPANDDFANATPIGSLPFQQSVDTSAATRQAGEPGPSCASGTLSGTVWYAYTPAASGSVSASASSRQAGWTAWSPSTITCAQGSGGWPNVAISSGACGWPMR